MLPSFIRVIGRNDCVTMMASVKQVIREKQKFVVVETLASRIPCKMPNKMHAEIKSSLNALFITETW